MKNKDAVEVNLDNISIDDVPADVDKDTVDLNEAEPEGLNQLEEALRKAEEVQSINDALISNTTTTWMVSGREIKIATKTINRMVKADRVILKLQRLSFETIEQDDDNPGEFWDLVEKKLLETYELSGEAISIIIDEDVDWVTNNIELVEGSIGDEIISAYKKKQSIPVVKKLVESRMF